MPYTPGSTHGPSIKDSEIYNSLRRQGKSKASAAAIANSSVNKGHRKGRHRKRRR